MIGLIKLAAVAAAMGCPAMAGYFTRFGATANEQIVTLVVGVALGMAGLFAHSAIDRGEDAQHARRMQRRVGGWSAEG